MAWWNAPMTQGFGPTDEPLDGAYDGYAHFNKGYDFGVPTGTPIEANVGGTVISAGDSGDGWGISVKVRDANGYTHNYGHLSGVSVSPGQTVSPGDLLGKSGSTGNSTGPHLSYDVWNSSGQFVNPSQWVGVSDGGAFGGSGTVGAMPDSSQAGPGGVTPITGFGSQQTSQYTPGQIASATLQQNWNTYAALTVNSPEVKAYAQQNGVSTVQALSDVKAAMFAELQSMDAEVESLSAFENGSVKDPTTGYYLSISSLDPASQAQAKQVNQQIWTDFQNKYLGDQYSANADRAVAQFNSKVAGVGQSLSYDQNALARSNSLISRQLQGMQEARSRAQFVNDSLTALAPWATGGKTSFTGNDFGQIGAEFAKVAGMDPNAVALKFPGSVTIDPQSLLQYYDQQAGVSGQLPGVPDMQTSPSLISGLTSGYDPGAVSFLPPASAPSVLNANGFPSPSLLSSVGGVSATQSQPTLLDSIKQFYSPF